MDGERAGDGRHQLDDALLAVVHWDAASARVRLEGEFDALNRQQFGRLIARLHTGGHRQVVLDVSALTLCDAGGLAAMIAADRRLRDDGGSLVLTGVRPLLARVLSVTGLDQQLQFVGARESVGADERA